MSSAYTWWSQVPEHLRTKTQLADLDLPRIPGAGPVDAIRTRSPHGRKDTFDLYDATASLPSPASAKQLESARAKQDPALRRCAECGARPDYPPTVHRVGGGRRARLCLACLHVARLRGAQYRNALMRVRTVELAATLLSADSSAVVHLTVITPPASDSGRARRPVALLLDAVSPSGTSLVRMPIRLARSRSPLVPEGAVDEAAALPALRDRLAGRDLIGWAEGSLAPVQDALTDGAAPAPWRQPLALEPMVAEWRAQIDPHTLQLARATDPGRADLMALLIRRIAAEQKETPR